MAYLKVTITDTMSFWDDDLGDYLFNPQNSSTFLAWYRVPDPWVSLDGTLPAERRESICKYLYGPDWRMGNGDGSKYQVLKMEVQQLSDAEERERPWAAGKESCYGVGEDGAFEKVEREQM